MKLFNGHRQRRVAPKRSKCVEVCSSSMTIVQVTSNILLLIKFYSKNLTISILTVWMNNYLAERICSMHSKDEYFWWKPALFCPGAVRVHFREFINHNFKEEVFYGQQWNVPPRIGQVHSGQSQDFCSVQLFQRYWFSAGICFSVPLKLITPHVKNNCSI